MIVRFGPSSMTVGAVEMCGEPTLVAHDTGGGSADKLAVQHGGQPKRR